MLPRKACKLHRWNCNLLSGSISRTGGGTICASRGKDRHMFHCNCFWFARWTEKKDEKVGSGLHFRSRHKLEGTGHRTREDNRVGFWWKKRACPVISEISSDGLHRVACIRLFQVLSYQVDISLTDRAFPSSTLSRNKRVNSQNQVSQYYTYLSCRLTGGGARKIP